VIFVPAKPYQQGWWIQDCAQGIERPMDESDLIDRKNSQRDKITDDNQPLPQIGPDLVRARAFCSATTAGVGADGQPGQNDQPAQQSASKNLEYRKWTPTSDAIFRELTLAVIAGVHIQEDSQNKPQITDLGCKKTAQGDLDLSQQANGSITCNVTGENLDKVAKLQLINAANALDKGIDAPSAPAATAPRARRCFR
jgi:hypothetical protein